MIDQWENEGGAVAEPLYVVQAAIREFGVVFTMPRPARHGHLIRAMVLAGAPPPITGEQGFVLSDGTFADRARAALVAKAAAQVRNRTGTGDLFTEDLW